MDATHDALICRKKQEEHLIKHISEQNVNMKKMMMYFGISRSAIWQKINKKRIDEEIKTADINYKSVSTQAFISETMYVADIKTMLKDRGIATKVRTKEKLIEILKLNM